MDIVKLFDALSAMVPLSDLFKSDLEKALTPLSLPNRYLLLESPKVSDQAYFIETGYAMSYSFYKGKKQVDAFWGPGQIVLSPKSFFDQVPSREFIQAMSVTELLCVSYSNAHTLMQSYPEGNIIQRALMIQYYQNERERLRDFWQLDTAQRHDKLLKQYPWIEQIIPQECIASYLGVTPQTLSRIKKEGGRA